MIGIAPMLHHVEAAEQVDIFHLRGRSYQFDHVLGVRLHNYLRRELRIDQNDVGVDGADFVEAIADRSAMVGEHLITDDRIGAELRVKYGSDVRPQDLLVEEVAHRVHKDHPGALPRERLQEALRSERQVEASLERVPGYAAKSLREPSGVAIVAASADFRAAGHRVPRRVRPLDS